MAEYEMAFILTDCEMKQVGDEIQIVKRSSLTPEMMNDFVPFNFAVIKGEEDDEGRIQQYVKGDDNEIRTGGVIAVGVMAMPWETVYTIGNKFTADDIYEFSEDGSVKTKGYANIERIILCKTKEDTEELVNYFAEVNASHGRPIKYAEESNADSPNFNPYGDHTDTSSAASQATEEMFKAENSEFFGAEYENHLIKLAHTNYPSHRMYESNV